MGLIREPLEVDFYVDAKPLTAQERQLITQRIKKYKEKASRSKKSKALKTKAKTAR